MDASTTTLETAFRCYRDRQDLAALAAVYDSAASRLHSIARRQAGAFATAEDAVQDTFLFALQHPESWDESRPLMPWLVGVLNNRLRRAVALESRAIDVQRIRVPDPATNPQAEFDAKETLSEIDDAIAHLPQPYRSVVLMRVRVGMSTPDIAAALRRRPGTIRVQLARGMNMLRGALPASLAAVLATAGIGSAATAPATAGATSGSTPAQLGAGAAQLRRWALGLAACAAVTVLTWSTWSSAVEASAKPQPIASDSLTTVTTWEPSSDVATTTVATTAAPGRQPVRTLGSLDVVVTRGAMGLPRATVELEPLGDRPIAFVHHTKTGLDAWSETVSGRPLSPAALRTTITRNGGTASFSRLSPGWWICRAMGVDALFEVKPGEHETVKLAADPRSALVEGTVLDPDGVPLPDTPIWLMREHRSLISRVHTHSDARGHFAIAVPPFTTIGASHDAFAPVAVAIPLEESSRVREITLRFDTVGAIATGLVVDARGRPVAGAEVQIGHSNDARVAEATDEAQVLARLHCTHTDSRGRFRFASLVPGHTQVVAASRAHGGARQLVALQSGATTEIELVLPDMAVVSGQVSDAAGNPVAGASVRVGRPGVFGYRATSTDRDGRYRLASLTPGKPTVEVISYGLGFASRAVDCAPGEECVWNPVLRRDNLVLKGQVLDEFGNPFAHGWIKHLKRSGERFCRLDHEGRFELPVSDREAALPSGIHVYDQKPRSAPRRHIAPVAVAGGLLTSTPDLVIRVPNRAAATARLRGRVLTATGEVPEGRVSLCGVADHRNVCVDLRPLEADGSFETGALFPGTYYLHMASTGGRAFGPIELAADTTQDVGVVRAPADVTDSHRHDVYFGCVFPHDILTTEPFEASVRDDNGWLVQMIRQGASIDGTPAFRLRLPPGKFELTAKSPSGLVANHSLVVDPCNPQQRAQLVVFQ